MNVQVMAATREPVSQSSLPPPPTPGPSAPAGMVIGRGGALGRAQCPGSHPSLFRASTLVGKQLCGWLALFFFKSLISFCFNFLFLYFFFLGVILLFFNPPIGKSRGTGARSQEKGWKNHMNNKKKKKNHSSLCTPRPACAPPCGEHQES